MTAQTKFDVGDTIRDTKRNRTFRVVRIKIEKWVWNGETLYGVQYRGPNDSALWCWEKDAEAAQ